MTKDELERDMKDFVGSAWINITDLARYLGYKDRSSARKYVEGLPRMGYKYPIIGVAHNIMRGLKND